MKVTIQETSTEIQPVYDGYPSRQHGSLNRSEVQRSYSNGHTASNATKELDDLMASLSEFKVCVNHEICHFIFSLFQCFIHLPVENIVTTANCLIIGFLDNGYNNCFFIIFVYY